MERASGGVAIYIDKNFINEDVTINSNIEAVAVTVQIKNKKVTVCNLYISNKHQLFFSKLENLIKQLPTPYIIVGDFNAHNQAWGSVHTDKRGKAIQQFINDFNIITLKNGSATHFNATNASTSIIDLTLCSCDIADFLADSDHYSIITTFIGSESVEHIVKPRFEFKLANLKLYQEVVKPPFF